MIIFSVFFTNKTSSAPCRGDKAQKKSAGYALVSHFFPPQQVPLIKCVFLFKATFLSYWHVSTVKNNIFTYGIDYASNVLRYFLRKYFAHICAYLVALFSLLLFPELDLGTCSVPTRKLPSCQ